MVQVSELIALQESEPLFDKKGIGTRRFNAYIRELTSQVNTSTSNIEEVNTQSSSNQQVLSQIVDLLKKQERVVNTTVDYTAQVGDIISCNNTSLITITTPINPIVGDILPAIKRTNGKVKVLGPIDGKTFKIINVKIYSMKLAYNGVEWIEI